MHYHKKSKLITDPKIIGPGVWFSIHIKAKYAVSDETKQEFIDYMYLLSVTFPCEKCQNHIKAYLETHPFDDLYNLKNQQGEEIGMFKWSWMFHNAVNTRIHKPYVDWNTAWEMYDIEAEICTKNCGEEEKLVNNVDTNKEKIIQGYFLQKGLKNTIDKNFYKY